MKPACTTRVRYVVKIAISTCKNGSLGLNVFFVACVVALMPCESAQSIPSTWGQSGTTGSQGNSFFRPQDDIFQGATGRPEIALPTGNFVEVPAGRNITPPGAAANAGAANIAGMGRFRQGENPSLGGILQGLLEQNGNGMFGNGVGVGPFGQFMGQNNQIMQGMQFVALLQQIFGMFFPADSAMQFNNANTGQSARTAFVNLMGANSSGVDGVPPVSPITAVPCSNGQKDRTKPFNELNASPATQVQLTKLCVKEVGSQGEDAQVALYETLFNRSTAEGNSIDRAMHNGYYEPINKGTVDSVSTSSSEYASCERALNRALAGSNTIGCRRHAATNCAYAKGFGGDPNSCVTIGGEAFYSKPGESCSGNFC